MNCIGPVSDHQRRRQRASDQLRKVNEMISAWEEFECAEYMPEDIRPIVQRPPVALVDLRQFRAELLGVISDLEDGWERRN
jgi:hypothetical protein